MMAKLKVKVCGMTNIENVQKVCSFLPDYLGFIFFSKSPRYVGKNPDPALFDAVPPELEKIAVFVNEDFKRIIEITGKYGIACIQLHGEESVGMCQLLRKNGLKVIKAIPGNKLHDLELIANYAEVTDYLLFDTPVESYGGSGEKFNWSVLEKLESPLPFFLSGGIAHDDADEILRMNYKNLFAIDVNSKFELSPGIKDEILVGSFIERIKNET